MCNCRYVHIKNFIPQNNNLNFSVTLVECSITVGVVFFTPDGAGNKAGTRHSEKESNFGREHKFFRLVIVV